jgi:hypothetical protein
MISSPKHLIGFFVVKKIMGIVASCFFAFTVVKIFKTASRPFLKVGKLKGLNFYRAEAT